MDSELMEALESATPAEAPAIPVEAATPQDGPEQQALPAASEWIELPDPANPGTVYTKLPSDPAKLAEWVIKRNGDYTAVERERNRLQAQIDLINGGGFVPRQAPEPVTLDKDPEVIAKARSLYADYSQRFDAEPEAIWAHAHRDAQLHVSSVREAVKVARQQIDSERSESAAKTFIDSNPVLRSDFGMEVFNKYPEINNPEIHLQLIKAEAADRGIDLSAYGVKPRLSDATKNHVAAQVAARTTALSSPGMASAAGQSPQPPPSPELLKSYSEMIALNDYTEEQKSKIWSSMQAKHMAIKRGAA